MTSNRLLAFRQHNHIPSEDLLTSNHCHANPKSSWYHSISLVLRVLKPTHLNNEHELHAALATVVTLNTLA